MNFFIVLIIIFLCVYLISKIFNFDEIKKQIFTLLAFFTLTNNTYPVKQGGVNENFPCLGQLEEIEKINKQQEIDMAKLYKLKQSIKHLDPTKIEKDTESERIEELIKLEKQIMEREIKKQSFMRDITYVKKMYDLQEKFVIPYIFADHIVVDGFNIFIYMRNKIQNDIEKLYQNKYKRQPSIDEINREAFTKMIEQLNRCFNGTMHVVIKTGQDNTLGNFLSENLINYANIIVYNAFYNNNNEQIESNNSIQRLSSLRNPTKEERIELHRLKSIDDHLLMLVASELDNVKIISCDKYRQIRKNPRELPNLYSYNITINKKIEGPIIINPTDTDRLNQLDEFLSNERNNFHTFVMFPILDETGEIELFCKYGEGLKYTKYQELLKEMPDLFIKPLYNCYTAIMNDILNNINAEKNINKFRRTLKIINDTLHTEYKDHSFMHEIIEKIGSNKFYICRETVNELYRCFENITKTGKIDQDAYKIIPILDRMFIMERHRRLIDPSKESKEEEKRLIEAEQRLEEEEEKERESEQQYIKEETVIKPIPPVSKSSSIKIEELPPSDIKSVQNDNQIDDLTRSLQTITIPRETRSAFDITYEIPPNPNKKTL
jgi:hypothetical protein